jgi:hypothetical protein
MHLRKSNRLWSQVQWHQSGQATSTIGHPGKAAGKGGSSLRFSAKAPTARCGEHRG